MEYFSYLREKVNALKAKVEQSSITPFYLGSILDQFITLMEFLDRSQELMDIQNEVLNIDKEVSDTQRALVFNGPCKLGAEEHKLLESVIMYKIIDENGSFPYKVLQTGIFDRGTSESRVVFNHRNILTDKVWNFYAYENDFTGIKKYECHQDYHKAEIVIDWDKFTDKNFSAGNFYRPDVSRKLTGEYLTVISHHSLQRDVDALKSSAGSDVDGAMDRILQLEENVKSMMKNSESHELTPFPNTDHVEYFRNGYVIYNEPFTADGTLNSVEFRAYSQHPHDTLELTVYIGKLDQRRLLINPRKYSWPFDEVLQSSNGNGRYSFDLSDKGVKVRQGEVMCFFSRRYQDGADGRSCLIEHNGVSTDKVLFSSDIKGEFTDSFEFTLLKYGVTYSESMFVNKSEMDETKNEISLLSAQIGKSALITDSITGEQYKLVVADGALMLKNVNYRKAVFIGSSFVNHVISPAIGWHRNGAMAPSVSDNSLPDLVLKGLKVRNPDATMQILNSLNWERGYDDEEYSFEADLKNPLTQASPDVIFMHISGNSTWSDNFEQACEALINNVKKTCPGADIYIAASWHGGPKAADFRQACTTCGVGYVDLSGLKVAENMCSAGDPYLGDDGKVYPIPAVVASHPNDLGCMRQANVYLRQCGYDPLADEYVVHMSVAGAAGNIRSNCERQIYNGLVKISFSQPSELANISIYSNDQDITEDAEVGIFKEENGGWYMVFRMPCSDVTVIYNS